MLRKEIFLSFLLYLADPKGSSGLNADIILCQYIVFYHPPVYFLAYLCIYFESKCLILGVSHENKDFWLLLEMWRAWGPLDPHTSRVSSDKICPLAVLRGLWEGQSKFLSKRFLPQLKQSKNLIQNFNIKTDVGEGCMYYRER